MPAQNQQTGATKVLKREMHKLHEAFVVAEGVTITEGQLVKLNNDGELVAAVANEPEQNIIGYAFHTRKEGEECTIVSRAFSTVLMEASADINAGPVKVSGFDTTDKLQTVAQAAVQTVDAGAGTVSINDPAMIGWALEKATSGSKVYVAIKN